MITRKTREQIALMRRAGRVVAEMHEECRKVARAGATTLDVDRVAREVIERRGARSNFLGYHGVPAVICSPPNDVIVHGIPSDDVVLAEGDILSIDCGAIIEGWHANAAVTVPIGEIDAESRRLLDRSIRWFLQTRGGALDVSAEVARFAPAVTDLAPLVPSALVGIERPQRM